MSYSQLCDDLKYDSSGLVPAVVQDASNGQVLMVGYMNRDAVLRTLETRRVTFWSRSRQQLWVKGETSGNVQRLLEARVDCDKDCLLVFVEQAGEACHEGYRTCFYRRIEQDGSLQVVEQQMRKPEEIYRKA